MQRAGITLVEVIIGVAVLAVLATVATTTWAHYREDARVNEARQNLKALGDGASAFSESHKSFPADEACSAGGLAEQKVPVSATDWSDPVWQALSFQPSEAHYYQYCYVPADDGRSFEASAEARLEGQSIDSRFLLTGHRSGTGAAVNLEESL